MWTSKLCLTLHEQTQAELSIILLNFSFNNKDWCQSRVNAIGAGSQNISGHTTYWQNYFEPFQSKNWADCRGHKEKWVPKTFRDQMHHWDSVIDFINFHFLQSQSNTGYSIVSPWRVTPWDCGFLSLIILPISSLNNTFGVWIIDEMFFHTKIAIIEEMKKNKLLDTCAAPRRSYCNKSNYSYLTKAAKLQTFLSNNHAFSPWLYWLWRIKQSWVVYYHPVASYRMTAWPTHFSVRIASNIGNVPQSEQICQVYLIWKRCQCARAEDVSFICFHSLQNPCQPKHSWCPEQLEAGIQDPNQRPDRVKGK